MGRTKFYGIVTCSLLMVHAAASNDGYYTKSDNGFEPSRSIFNERYTNRDNINQRNINTYDAVNRDRDYSFSGRINQQNIQASNSPAAGHSTDSGPPGYVNANYETVNSNLNFMKESLPFNFGKYFANNSTRESDFGKYGHPDLSQFSSDHHHEGSYTDFLSGNYPTEVPASFASMGYEQGSDTSIIDDTYINNDHQQLYGKQRGNNFNSKGNYNYGNDALHIFSSDMYHAQEGHDIRDQIQGFNQYQAPHLNDLPSAMSNSYFSNVHDKGINFHNSERPNNYKGNKYLSIYPSKSNLNYVIKGYKNNVVPQNYAKGNGKGILIKIGGSSIRPRYVYSGGLYHPHTKLDVSEGYKKKRSNLLNRQRRPVPVNLLNLSHNNGYVNENYDDIQSSEMYNRNSDYTDNVGLNTFSAYS
ncbi:hypothetical protein KPH14_004857 [Odynerus spinipes]|uniref:Uncharacterized protein n=1 Tax=Odynerus spinipes TaxID=1348599 RepID=A0AAD9RMY5_9HYME|nr:hypothetical protein KPH14_004857 [Odynerus spinipes]